MNMIINKLFSMETPTILSNYITWLYTKNVFLKIILWPLNVVIGFFLLLVLSVITVHFMYSLRPKKNHTITVTETYDKENDEWHPEEEPENWYDELTPKEQDDFNNYGELPF